jgi:hypothetical protein
MPRITTGDRRQKAIVCPTSDLTTRWKPQRHIYASNLGSNAFKYLTSVSRTMAPVSNTSS